MAATLLGSSRIVLAWQMVAVIALDLSYLYMHLADAVRAVRAGANGNA
jgi:hypothetical protein